MKLASAAARTCIALLLIFFALACESAAQAVANKQAILSQARGAYYNLRNEGLSTFECNLTPNWDLLLQDLRKQDAESAESAVKTLNQLHFSAVFGADDSVKLKHNELAGQNERMTNALQQIYQGMEQMASGFFDTWKLFMVNHPFPEVGDEYQLDLVGPDYRLAYRQGSADVVTTMGRDFTIGNVKISTPEFDSSLQPRFTKTPKGFVLNSYNASYQSQKPEETTKLSVAMEYQQVEGMQMPQKLSLTGTYGGAAFAVDLGFSDCRVTKKQ
jgi:hypothetical protein